MRNIDSRILQPSLFPQYDIEFHDMKMIQIPNAAFKSNNYSSPYSFLLMANELYWITENSVKMLAILTDISMTRNDDFMINITSIQVIAHRKVFKFIF